MADRNDEGPSPRGSGGGGAPPFADFSSFREMVGEEREAAQNKMFARLGTDHEIRNRVFFLFWRQRLPIETFHSRNVMTGFNRR